MRPQTAEMLKHCAKVSSSVVVETLQYLDVSVFTPYSSSVQIKKRKGIVWHGWLPADVKKKYSSKLHMPHNRPSEGEKVLYV